MTLQHAIESAIRSGYKPALNWKNYEQESHLLSPDFWRALGKSEGWGDKELEVVGLIEEWKHRMISLMRHLAEGGTIESFFQTL